VILLVIMFNIMLLCALLAYRITVNNKTGLDIDVVPAAGVLGGALHSDVAHVALANFFAKKVGGIPDRIHAPCELCCHKTGGG
jgi:hypothetical protein